MGPLHHVLNRVHAWNEQGSYTFKSVICSRATNLCVSAPLSALAVAQNILAIPFTAAGTAAKLIVKPVACISGSRALNRLANNLPGITDLLLRIANIIRYVLAGAVNATLGVLAPTANFKAQCALGTTYNEARVRALHALAQQLAAAEAAQRAAAEQAAAAARQAEAQAKAEGAKKVSEPTVTEAARKAAIETAKKAAEQAAAETARKVAEQAAAEAARKAAEQAAAEAARKAAEKVAAEAASKTSEQTPATIGKQTTEIVVTDPLEMNELLTQLMESDEYELEEELPTPVAQDNWVSALLSKIRAQSGTQAA